MLHFLHGNGFCGRTYEPLLRLLAADFDLWLCDVQGHGDSDHGGRFHGWNRSAELAVEAFAAGRAVFGAVPCFAVGHSFGGVLTSLMLAQQPQLFQRALLLDPVLESANAFFTCPKICGSPNTSESSPLATRIRWLTASLSWCQ